MALVPKKPKIHESPRISVNKLAEYIHASPNRRKIIIRDAKHPPEYQTLRYKDAREILVKYCINGFDKNQLVIDINNLKKQAPLKTDKQRQDRTLSIEALEVFKSFKMPKLDGFKLIGFGGADNYLSINKVKVVIHPDVLIIGEHKGKKIKGAIKFHISKSNKLTKDTSPIVAMLLNDFINDKLLKDNEATNTDFCISICVFSGTYNAAPKSVKQRKENVDASCEEICLRWPLI